MSPLPSPSASGGVKQPHNEDATRDSTTGQLSGKFRAHGRVRIFLLAVLVAAAPFALCGPWLSAVMGGSTKVEPGSRSNPLISSSCHADPTCSQPALGLCHCQIHDPMWISKSLEGQGLAAPSRFNITTRRTCRPQTMPLPWHNKPTSSNTEFNDVQNRPLPKGNRNHQRETIEPFFAQHMCKIMPAKTITPAHGGDMEEGGPPERVQWLQRFLRFLEIRKHQTSTVR